MIVIIVGYAWCPHYHHAIAVLNNYPQYLMPVRKRRAEGKKELLHKIQAVTFDKTPLGKVVGETSPQVFVRYHDIVYCLGGDDDVTRNKTLINRYFI